MHSDLINQLNQLAVPSQRLLLNAANDLLNFGKPLSEDSIKELEQTGCGYGKCLDFLGLYIKVIREFCESDPKEFNKKMLLMGYSEDFVNNSISQLSQMRFQRCVEFDKLTSFKWRLDISFFDSKSLEKIPVPIIISLKTNNGKKYVIEMDRKAFHKLRFTVALLIKDMLSLKNISSLKL